MRRRLALTGVAALTLVLLAAAVARGLAGSPAVGHRAAVSAALRALGVTGRSGPEIVFGLGQPLPAGTVVSEGGPGSPTPDGVTATSGAPELARTVRPAWFFYDDLAPYQQYQHAGRVALVDALTGRVIVSRALQWPPLVDGALPQFLRSSAAYDSGSNQVFARPYSSPGLTFGAREKAAADQVHRDLHARIDPARGRVMAALLAADRTCFVRLGQGGRGYYQFAELAPSRSAIGLRFAELQSLDRRLVSVSDSEVSSVTPTELISRLIASHGCHDVLAVALGGGFARHGAVNLGMVLGRQGITHQDLTLGSLQSLAAAHRNVRFQIVIDAPGAAGFHSLTGQPNITFVATPGGPAGEAFTYLPSALVGGHRKVNRTNPRRLLQFSDRLVYGMDRAFASDCEITTAAALDRGGQSGLSYLLVRSFALGWPVDFAYYTGASLPPSITVNGVPTGAPQCATSRVNAAADAYSGAANAVLTVPAGQGVLANDTDSAAHPLVVDGLNGTGGKPPLHGTSSRGAPVTLNADGSFSYDPTGVAAFRALAHDQTLSDTFSYHVSDGHGGAASATVTITVGGVNHSPVAHDDTGSANNNASLAGSSVLSNDTDADGDALTVDQLNGSTTLTGASAKGAALTIHSDGTYSYDPTASATLQAIPRGSSTTDTFTYRAVDGHGGSSTATVTVTVTGAVNHPPHAAADTYTTGNGTTLSVPAATGLLANDSDPDGDTLAVSDAGSAGGSAPFQFQTATGATVAVQADGSFSYDPTTSSSLAALVHGAQTNDTFSYSIDDGHGGSDSASVTITVTGANHSPVANADSASANNDAALSGSSVLANDTDADNDSLTVDRLNGSSTLSGTSVKGAAVTIQAGGTYSYDPTGSATLQAIPRGTSTTDTFSYRVNDGHGGTASATVTITVSGVINHPPVAVADSYSVANTSTLSVPGPGVLGNDTDADSDPLTVDQLNGSGTGGAPFTATTANGAQVKLNADGSFSYDPSGSATLQAIPRGGQIDDSFSYEANDGHGGVASATVIVTVNGALNHSPVAVDDSYSAGNDATLTVPASSGVTVNDTDADGDSLAVDQLNGSATLTGTSADGAAVTLNAGGSFSYDPSGSSTLQALPRGTTTTDTFTYRVGDGHTGESNTATVSITVTGNVNHAPVGVPDSGTANNNAQLSGSSVLTNDTDADNDSLTVDQLNGSSTLTGTSVKGAAVTIDPNGTYTYDPTGSATLQAIARGQSTTDTFKYRAGDGRGGETAQTTVTITVSGVINHAPVATTDTYSVANTATLSVSAPGVLGNDTDADNDPLAVDQLNGSGAGGAPFSGMSADGAQVTLNADGSFSYDPSGSATLQAIPRGGQIDDSFSYEASDGHGGVASATVVVTVTGAVNHPPVAVDDSYSAGNDATLTVPASSGVTVNDTDADGDVLSVDQLNGSGTLTGTSADGAAVTLSSDGSFSYDPSGSSVLQAIPRGTTTTDTFTYRVGDGHTGESNTATVSIAVTGNINHPPVANADSGSVNNNAALSGSSVLANDTDADNDSLTVDRLNGSSTLSGTSVKGAAVTIQAGGTYSYDPTGSATLQAIPRGTSTTDTFSYRANDGHGGTASATVTITVTGVINHPPVAVADSYSTNSDAVLTVPAAGVLTNDTDTDADTLAVDQLNGSSTLTGTSADGATVTLGSGGAVSYDATNADALNPPQLAAGQTAQDTFTYRANDGHGGESNTATVTVTVTSHVPAPTAGTFTVATSAVPNTLLEVGSVASPSSEPKLTDGDNILSHVTVSKYGSAATLTAGTTTSAHGGNVTTESNGAFSYRPAAGYTGADSFTYTVTNNGGSSQGTVNLNVGTQKVWYVQNNATGTDDGRSGSPFHSLAEAESASGSGTGDIIYVFPGDGTTANQDAGLTLKASQTLLGEGYPLIVGGKTLYAGHSGDRPAIGNSSGSGVTLASGDTVKGFSIAASGSGAASVLGPSGAAAGTLTDLTMSGASASRGVDLESTSGTWALSVISATTPGDAVHLNAAGTVGFSGISNSLSSSGGAALLNTGATTLSGTIASASSSGGADGIQIDGASGSLTISGGSLSGFSANGFEMNGGSASVRYDGSITGTAGHSVNVQSLTGSPTINLTGAISDSGTGLDFVSDAATIQLGGQITANTAGNVAFNATGTTSVTATNTANVLTTATATALNVSGTAVTLVFHSVSAGTSTSGPARGISAAGTGSLTVNGGTIQHTSATGGDGGIYLNGLSTVDLEGVTSSNNVASGVYALGVPTLTVAGGTFAGNGVDGVADMSGSNTTQTIKVNTNSITGNLGSGIDLGSGNFNPPAGFTINANTVSGTQGTAINVANFGSGTWAGHITNNQVGVAGTANSGSVAGAGIQTRQQGSGTLTADVSSNTIHQIESEWGIEGVAGQGSGHLNLTLSSNAITTDQASSQDAITVQSGLVSADTSTVCVNATGNIATTSGTATGNGLGFDGVGMSVLQYTSGAHFQIQGYPGSATDDAGVQAYLAYDTSPLNTFTGPGGPTYAQHNGTNGFTNGTCAAAPAGPARDLGSRARVLKTSALKTSTRKTSTRKTSTRKTSHSRHTRAAVRRPSRSGRGVPSLSPAARHRLAIRRERGIARQWQPRWMRRHRSR